MNRSLAKLSSLVLFALAASCGGTSTPGPSTTFTATLNSAAENNSANTSAATGTATFTISGTSISYTVNYSGLSSAPSASHLHIGATGSNGAVVVPFTGLPTAATGTFSGTFDTTNVKTQVSPPITNLDDVIAQMRSGGVYVNIHTSANPGGEIRGQLAGQ
jgi:Cu/Zn superoxide dismutase